MNALEELDAYSREPGNRRLKPKLSVLAGPNPNLFNTSSGPLDLLGTIDEGLGYAELLPNSIEIELAGLKVSILSLKLLIEIKRRAGRPKDLIALPILERALSKRGSIEESP